MILAQRRDDLSSTILFGNSGEENSKETLKFLSRVTPLLSSRENVTPTASLLPFSSLDHSRRERGHQKDPLRTSAACRLAAAMISRVHVYIRRLLPPPPLPVTRIAAAASRNARGGERRECPFLSLPRSPKGRNGVAGEHFPRKANCKCIILLWLFRDPDMLVRENLDYVINRWKEMSSRNAPQDCN